MQVLVQGKEVEEVVELEEELVVEEVPRVGEGAEGQHLQTKMHQIILRRHLKVAQMLRDYQMYV